MHSAGSNGAAFLDANSAPVFTTGDALTYTLNGDRPVTKTFSTPTSSLSVSVVPDVRGVNSLTVQTWDAAGNSAGSSSGTYFFDVAAGAPPVDSWPFDEGTGTSAADAPGGHTATLSSGAAWSDTARLGKALQGDGSTGYASASASGIDTAESFTVSGWARLTGTTHNAVVVAQAGVNGSAFDTPWQATGVFTVGGGRTATRAYGDWTTGLVDDIRVWTGVMSAADIDQTYLAEVPLPL